MIFNRLNELFKAPAATSTDPEALYFARLEVSPGSDFEHIKSAYKQLLKEYDPGRFTNNEERRQQAQGLINRINEAYLYFEKKFSKPSDPA